MAGEDGGTAPDTASSETVYLVDASPYIFRAFFSLPDSIRTPDGAPIHAAYGFASFLCKLIGEEEVDHLAVTFDESLNTSFRNELYPEYKAQRELPPADLEAQLDACQALSRAFGATTLSDDRLEADDIVGTLAEQVVAQGHRAVVVTSDKDLAQLVGDRVSLYDFGKDERLGPAEVVERFGCRPEQVPDLLALQGDPVDNIPGVPGVGKKTATALLAAFADLDDLYARLDEVADLSFRGARTLAPKLEENREIAFLSRRLATVVRDGDFDGSLEALAYAGADRGALEPLFDRLGFGGIRERVPRWREES